MNSPLNLSFSTLSPDVVLDALESIDARSDGRLLALNSYENRVYLIGMEEGPSVVAKFYRSARWSDQAILEEHDFLHELVEREIPVVAPLSRQGKTLHTFHDFRFSIFPMRGGRAPELDDRSTLEWLGRFIGRIHAVGAIKPYHHRPTLDMASFGEEPVEFLLAQGFIPPDLQDAYQSVATLALEGVRNCFDRAGTIAKIRLHGDCHCGNVLCTDAGMHFVDFDDSRMGPAVQDLWMLLSGDRADRIRQMSDLLAGYTDFYEFNERELFLIEGLRTLRLLHYSSWLARRWEDPAFPLAFPWFNTTHYWQDRILELREQIALMEEAPLWAA